jgi:hypothetical protein
VSDGYSYTTITATPGEPTSINVSFHLDDQAWIFASDEGSEHPHVSIHHGNVSVRIGPHPGPVTEQDAQLARTLADKAALYAAEVERLWTVQAASSDTGQAA